MKKYIALAILIELMDGSKHTAVSLAQKYETSVKTIYRAIDTLLEADLPIISYPGREGGYALLTQKHLDCSFFTTKELSSFISFIKSNPSHLFPIDKSNLDQRLSSLSNLKLAKNIQSESQNFIIDTEIWGSNVAQTDKINLINEAISNSFKIKINYDSKTKLTRVIHPYTLVFKAGVWYVYSFCEHRNNFRLFKMSKIRNLTKLETQFERKQVDVENKPWNVDFKHNSELIELEIICDESTLSDLTDWLGEDIKIIKTSTNLIAVKAKALYSFGLIHRLMQFGDKIKIINPTKLRDSLTEECNKIINNYK